MKKWSVPVIIGTLLLFFLLLNLSYFAKNATYFWGVAFHDDEFASWDEGIVFREPDHLYIDRLRIAAPVIYITEKGEAAYQSALQHGVVHYPGTADPGEYGNVYIFGHSSDLPWAKGDYKTVFATLPNIQLGDEIDVTNVDGQVFTYVVIETKIVSPKDLSVLDQYNNERKLLSVQTSYPVGTALQRFVAIAELKEDAP